MVWLAYLLTCVRRGNCFFEGGVCVALTKTDRGILRRGCGERGLLKGIMPHREPTYRPTSYEMLLVPALVLLSVQGLGCYFQILLL